MFDLGAGGSEKGTFNLHFSVLQGHKCWSSSRRPWDSTTEIGHISAGAAEVLNVWGIDLNNENKPRREEKAVTYDTMCSTFQKWQERSTRKGVQFRRF